MKKVEDIIHLPMNELRKGYMKNVKLKDPSVVYRLTMEELRRGYLLNNQLMNVE